MTADLHPRADRSAPEELSGVVFLLALIGVLMTLVLLFV